MSVFLCDIIFSVEVYFFSVDIITERFFEEEKLTLFSKRGLKIITRIVLITMNIINIMIFFNMVKMFLIIYIFNNII